MVPVRLAVPPERPSTAGVEETTVICGAPATAKVAVALIPRRTVATTCADPGWVPPVTVTLTVPSPAVVPVAAPSVTRCSPANPANETATPAIGFWRWSRTTKGTEVLPCRPCAVFAAEETSTTPG